MTSASESLFTIGHSAHSYERLVELLRGAGATAVADVRTAPHSRRFPHFNRGVIEARMRLDGIAYSFLGAELGGRPKGSHYYRDGVADYERMAAAPELQQGLKRVTEGLQRYRIALMCAEQNPRDCHRCLLVSRALLERGFDSRHILPDGRLVSQAEIEEELLAASGRGQEDLFASRQERLAAAYRERARKVAFAVAAGAQTGAKGEVT
jgi:uncharacterized protein (DUF488 family)